MCAMMQKVWKTCSITLSHVSRNELANLLPPLDDLGFTTKLCCSYDPTPQTVCHSFPKDKRGSA